jgi:hypothetical protein
MRVQHHQARAWQGHAEGRGRDNAQRGLLRASPRYDWADANRTVQFRKHIEKDGALTRRFLTVFVKASAARGVTAAVRLAEA